MHISQYRRLLLSLMLGGTLAVSGCASTSPKKAVAPVAESEQDKKASEKISVEYINVVGDGDKVMIGTTGTTRYTVFKLSDPPRLIVDLPGVDLSKLTSAVSVENDFLSEINAITYGDEKDIGRIVINLKEGVDHEVKSGENSILVSLKKADATGAISLVKATVEPVEEKDLPAPSVKTAKNETVAPEEPAVEEKASKPATRILKIEATRAGENTILRIATDGDIGNFNSFELESPSRIVVDMWGVDNQIGKDTIKLDNKFVKSVRIGSHPDKARLVLDASGQKFPPYSVKKVNDSIVITMGPNVTPEKQEAKKEVKPEAAPNTKYAPKAMELGVAHMNEATAAKPETPVKNGTPAAPAVKEPAPAPAAPALADGAKIEKVDFRRLNDKGRLTVARSAKTGYTVKESQDGKTVVIDVLDAVIPDDLVRTLDATKLKTPVVSISSYQETLKPQKDVRILVKLAEKARYEVKEDNGAIHLDFSTIAAAAEEKAAVTQQVPQATAETGARKEYAGKKIDLDMIDANVTDVLRLLAEVSNLNIIASDEVKGTISLRLKNVPWDQAFDIILKAKDLDSIREGNVVRVAPSAKIRQERESVLTSSRAQEKLESLDTKFIPVSYANVEELMPHVKAVLTDRGSVTSEKRTSTLIVRDVKRGLEAAGDLVAKLDKTTPQVLIEARIVEASSSFARDLGIQWGVDYKTGGNVHTDFFGSTTQQGQSAFSPGTQTSTGTSPNFPYTKTDFPVRVGATNYAVNLPASGTAGTLGALGFIFGKAGQNPLILDLRLSAGESEGRLKTISRPRITTLDNKEAKIEQGESVPFETTSAAGTATTFIDANLSLTVTPHITPDGSVLMKIKASRNSIGTFRTASGQPSINKKESTTEVLVKDGETTVIGGIVISDKNESDKGIPFLKDIPVLGWIFKSKSVSDSQTELLIFITPTIMRDQQRIQG